MTPGSSKLSAVSIALALAWFAAAPLHPASAAVPRGSVPGVPDSALAAFDGGFLFPTEFGRSFAGLTPTDRPPGDALKSRQDFLPQVVDRVLLAREAVRRRPVLTPREELEITRQRDVMMQNALFGKLTKDVRQPTDEDIDHLRRQKATNAEIRFVTFADWDRARSWRSRLNTGTPWSSLDATIAREGAAFATSDSFRFVAASEIPDTLATVIWSMRPGQVSDIFSFANQPTVILVRRFQTRPDQLMGSQVEDLKTEYLRKIYDRIREDYRSQLATHVGRTFDDAGINFLLQEQLKLPTRNDVDTTTGLPITRTGMPLPVIAPADTGRALARIKGHTVTIGEYLTYWGRIQPFARPELRERLSLEGAVDRVALAPELVRVALEQGLDKDPVLVERLARMRESFAVDHLFMEEIQAKVVVTDAALRRQFTADPGHYDDRASIQAHIVVVDHQSLADSLLARAKGGASFSELAKAYSIDGTTASSGGDTGIQYKGTQRNTGLEDAMFATPVGQLGGPERTPEGWVIWRIDHSTPGLKRTFEQAREMVERDYRILEADRLLRVKLEGLRKSAHVRMFPERIDPKLGADGPWGD